MIGFQRQRQMFAAQFEAQGEGYIYRKHSVGEPIPVSAGERERFMADFESFIRRSFWTMVAALAVVAAVLAGLWFAAEIQVPDMTFYLIFGAMLIAYMSASFQAWNRPQKELSGRG